MTKSSPSIWCLLHNVKLTMKIPLIFVPFLENRNFNFIIFLVSWENLLTHFFLIKLNLSKSKYYALTRKSCITEKVGQVFISTASVSAQLISTNGRYQKVLPYIFTFYVLKKNLHKYTWIFEYSKSKNDKYNKKQTKLRKKEQKKLSAVISSKKGMQSRNGILLPKLFWPTVRKKIVLVIEKNFWNSRLKAGNLQNSWDH